MIQMNRIPGYLTIAEVAARIGLSHSMTARYIRAGHLRAIDLGGQKLIAESDARKFRRRPVGNPNLIGRKARRSG